MDDRCELIQELECVDETVKFFEIKELFSKTEGAQILFVGYDQDYNEDMPDKVNNSFEEVIKIDGYKGYSSSELKRYDSYEC